MHNFPNTLCKFSGNCAGGDLKKKKRLVLIQGGQGIKYNK
jgi:hypothetical protein